MSFFSESSWVGRLVQTVIGKQKKKSKGAFKQRTLKMENLEGREMLNVAPIANDDTVLTTQGSAIVVDYVLSNDTDADGDTLAFSSVTAPANGTVVNDGNGSYTYTPTAGFIGNDTFNYTVSDGQGGSDTGQVTVSVNASFDAEAARTQILANVSSLVGLTEVAQMVAYGPTAISITNLPGEDESKPLVTASTMGQGRVIGMGGRNNLNMGTLGTDANMANFYKNSVAWLADTTSKDIKIVTSGNSKTRLTAQGYTNVVTATSGTLATELQTADVYIPSWIGGNTSTVDTIRDFVKGGGGLMINELPSRLSSLWGLAMPDMPGNLILRDAGIGFITSHNSNGPHAINRATGQTTAEDMLIVLADSSGTTQATRDKSMLIFDQLNKVLAETDTLQTRVNEVFIKRVVTITPTPASPVTDPFEMVLLNRESDLLQEQSISEMTPHRAALPVGASEPRVNTTFTVDPTIAGHAYLVVDTGMYAAPAEIVTITVPASMVNAGLKVQISHLRTKTGSSEYKVMQKQVFTTDITSTTIQVANPHGGLIAIVVPQGKEITSAQSIQINGAVRAPYFKLGETTDAAWNAGIRDRDVPFSVFVSDKVTLVFKTGPSVKELSDPNRMMQLWRDTIWLEDDFYNYQTGRPLRIHQDYYPVGGASSFPLSYRITAENTTPLLSYRFLINNFSGLTLHEHGHHADSSKLFFSGFSETTPNLGGKYIQAMHNKFTWKSVPDARGRIDYYLSSKSKDLWNSAPHNSVGHKAVFVESIGEAFGWDKVRTIVHKISALPGSQVDSSEKKMDQWLIQSSQTVGFDISPFLLKWQLTFSQSALDTVSSLSKWDMVVLLGEDLAVKKNGSIQFTDPSKNDFSYDETLVFNGLINPAHGTVVDHGNGNYTYTPNTNYTGKDAIKYTVTNATGNTFTGTINVTVTSNANYPRLQSGDVHASTSGWTTVTLDESYSSMVVVAHPVIPSDTPSLVTRIRNASGNSFQVKLQRSDSQSGDINNIPVQFMVVEEGVYNVADHGIKMEAIKFNSTVTDTGNNLVGQNRMLSHELLDHYYLPNIFGQVMTTNDSDWSAFWSQKGLDSYTVGKHVGSDSDTTRANETLGFIVMESGRMQIGKTRFRVGAKNGSNSITSRFPSLTSAIYSGSSTILFSNMNSAPAAMDDTVVLEEGAFATVDVLSNDTLILPGSLSIASYTQPSSGSVVDNGNGKLIYVPNSGFLGQDLFTYTASNGNGENDTAVVRVTVLNVPTATHQWKLDEGTGTSVADSAGSSNGSLVNGPTWTSGKYGQSLQFDGVNDAVNINGMTSNSTFTLSAWIKPDTVSGKHSLVGQQSSFSFRVIENKLVLTTIGKKDFTATTGNITTGQWQHVAVTFIANGAVKFYRNGVLFSTLQDSWGVNANSNTTWIGRNQWGQYFDGGIDDVRYFDQARSAAEIQAIMNDSGTSSNTVPNAVNDSITTAQNVAHTFNPRSNDTDADGDSLTITGKTNGSNGSVSFTSSNVTYTPNNNYTGSDSFTYTISDGNGGADTATVNVTVTGSGNTVPNAVNDSITTSQNVAHTFNPRSNDTDADGDSLTITGKTNGSNGSVSFTSSNVTYTPNNNYTGSDSFTYTISDGNGGADTATVNVTVNATSTSPKLFQKIETNVTGNWKTINLGQNYNSAVIVATPMIANNSIPVVTRIRNVSGSTFQLKLQHVDSPAGAIPSMSVSIIVVEEGVYTQGANGVKMEAVKYNSTVTDRSGAWNAQSRSYQNSYSTPVVVGQVMTENDSQWSAFWSKGSSVGAPPSSNALNVGKHVGGDTNATRIDETVGYIVIEAGNGTLDGTKFTAGVGADIVKGTDDTTTGYNYSLTGLSSAGAAAVSQMGMDGTDGGWATLFGTNSIQSNSLTLAIDEDAIGDDERNHTTEQVGYLVLEGTGSSNTVPNAVNDSITTAQNVAHTFNPRSNDTDADGDSLTITGKTNGSNGSVSFTSSNVTYTPNNNYTGSDSFTYTISDGNGGADTATVNVTVTGSGNTVPNAVNDSITTSQNVAHTFNPRSNDTDADGDSLTITGKTNGSNGSVSFTSSNVTYTPNNNYTGSDSFTYTISDGNGGADTATVNVTVNATGGGSTQTFTNNNNVAISSTSTVTVTSNIVVSGMSGSISDVNLAFDITHTWVADIELTLIAPDGTRIDLFTGIGGGSNNFTNTILDDEASSAINSSSAPYTGTFRPENDALSLLDGKSPNGTWTLEIKDTFAEDGGSLNDWALTITTT